MSYSQTTNLELYKENDDEPIKNLRTHNNSNMDTLDTQIQALKDVITNAKALLGQLGVDANGDPVIDASTARGTLGAAWDNSSGTNLYAVNQAVSDNATAIASLQDSVSGLSVSSDQYGITLSIADSSLAFFFQLNPNAKRLDVNAKINGTWLGGKKIAEWS